MQMQPTPALSGGTEDIDKLKVESEKFFVAKRRGGLLKTLLKKHPQVILVISLGLLFGSAPCWAHFFKHPEYSFLTKNCIGLLAIGLDVIGCIGFYAAVKQMFGFMDDLPL